MIIKVEVSERDLLEYMYTERDLSEMIHVALSNENIPVTAIDIEVTQWTNVMYTRVIKVLTDM